MAEHLSKRIRSLPRRCKRANPTGTRTANGASIRIGGERIFCTHGRQNLFQQKPDVLIAERIIFETAVADRPRAGRHGWEAAGINENSNGDRQPPLMNQVIKDNGNPRVAGLADVAAPVLEDHHIRGLVRRELRRHIDPIIANGAGENCAAPLLLGDHAVRHSRLALGIGAQQVRARFRQGNYEALWHGDGSLLGDWFLPTGPPKS